MTLVAAAAAKSLQSCPTLCDPIDSSPPGSPVPGILKARTLEWVAMTLVSGRLFLVSLGTSTEYSTPLWIVGQLITPKVFFPARCCVLELPALLLKDIDAAAPTPDLNWQVDGTPWGSAFLLPVS